MAIEKVKAYLRNYGMEERVLELDMSSATVELAAQALHCQPERIAKTLSFLVEGRAVLVVAAGDAKIDNGKYKAQFAAKAKMLTPQEAEELCRVMGRVFIPSDQVGYFIISAVENFEELFGRPADKRRKLYNGMVQCQLYMYFPKNKGRQ